MENNKHIETAQKRARKLQEAESLLEVAKLAYHKSIKSLHVKGMSYREIAAELSLSHQRVHQIVSSLPDTPLKTNKEAHCSLCKTNDDKKSKLIKAKDANVCHTCLTYLSKTLHQTKGKSKKHKSKKLDKESKSKCLICNNLSSKKRFLVQFKKNQICSHCVDQLSTKL